MKERIKKTIDNYLINQKISIPTREELYESRWVFYHSLILWSLLLTNFLLLIIIIKL